MSTNQMQLSTSIVLRPYWRFEAQYDTIDGAYPVVFSYPANPDIPAVGGQDTWAFDPEARRGTNGFSPVLGQMVPVHFGSTINLWIPQVPGPVGSYPEWAYVWRICWRLRNVADFQISGKEFNIYKQSFGPQELVGGALQDRYIIPAGIETVLVQKAEPPPQSVLTLGRLQGFYSNAYSEAYGLPADGRDSPPLPKEPGGGALDVQQGIIYYAAGGGVTTPQFRPVWSKICGNEFAIWCHKYDISNLPGEQPVTRAWDFGYNIATGAVDPTAEDYEFSRMFGIGAFSPNVGGGPFNELGVYAFTGGAPA